MSTTDRGQGRACRPKARGQAAPELREPVTEVVGVEGFEKAADALGVSPQTLGKLAAGLPVMPAILTHVRAKLAERTAAAKATA